MHPGLPSMSGVLLCCGLIGCGVRVSPEEAEAITAIERLGGQFKRDERRAGRPVVEVRLGGSRVCDADLVHLTGLAELETLSFHDSAVGDTGLRSLHSFTRLQTLYLGRTQVTDEGLAHLGGLKQLKTLGLTETRVTDLGLAHLRSLTNLKSVNLHGARVTSLGISALEQALPGLVVHR